MKKIITFTLIISMLITAFPTFALSGEIDVIKLEENFNSYNDGTITSSGITIGNVGGYTEIHPREYTQNKSATGSDKALFVGNKEGKDGIGYIEIPTPQPITSGVCKFEMDFYISSIEGSYGRLFVGEDLEKSHTIRFANSKLGSFELPLATWFKLRFDISFESGSAVIKCYKNDVQTGDTIITNRFSKVNFLRIRPYFGSSAPGFMAVDNIKYTASEPKGEITSINGGSEVSYDTNTLSFTMDHIPYMLSKEHIALKSEHSEIKAESIEIADGNVSCVFDGDIKSWTDYKLVIAKEAYNSDDVVSDVHSSLISTSKKSLDVKEPVLTSPGPDNKITVELYSESHAPKKYNLFVVVYKEGLAIDIKHEEGILTSSAQVEIPGLPSGQQFSYRVVATNGWEDMSLFTNKVWSVTP
ncbi:MAG: hypothetical protein IJN40_07370 [Clostridia bacterium]|nr:hypothetical protein [Clostridia bacterium]